MPFQCLKKDCQFLSKVITMSCLLTDEGLGSKCWGLWICSELPWSVFPPEFWWCHCTVGDKAGCYWPAAFLILRNGNLSHMNHEVRP